MALTAVRPFHDNSTHTTAWVWFDHDGLAVEHCRSGRWHVCRPEGTPRQWRKGGVDEVVRCHLVRKTGHGEPVHGALAGPDGTHGGGGLVPWVKAPVDPDALSAEQAQQLHHSGLIEARDEAFAVAAELASDEAVASFRAAEEAIMVWRSLLEP